MTGYTVYVLPAARQEIDHLPGHVRQRVRRAVIGLRDDPKPAQSKRLEFDVGPGRELRRLRLESWRVVYLIDQAVVYVLTARRRPPYQYADLDRLLTGIQ
jgi:mRNA interferase RelE/StbE